MLKVWLCVGLVALLLTGTAMAATEETKQTAIDNGLAWLATTQTVSGAEGYWSYANNGTLAATASAALAFIEEGYLPGDASIYDDVITRAVTYIFNRARVDTRFGVETAGYQRYAEDYDNNGIYDDGNDEAIYFEPGAATRRVYTSGICTPVVYALGEALGTSAVVGVGSSAISGKTYAQAMQDIVDWFSWAQVEPNRGNYRGGWRYDANYSTSDNSTAQWGSLPLLYAGAWGLGTPQFVFNELTLWVNYIQHPSGGSGYDIPTRYVNVAKTGGLLLELAAIGAAPGDPRVVAAVNFINSRWNNGPSGMWYGNLNHPYAMWAVYKGLQVYGYLGETDCGLEDIVTGSGIPAAPGGFSICFDAAPSVSAAGDWYSHYCDYLTTIQNGNGSWTGYSYWGGYLGTGWYINILNAVPVPVGPFEVAFDIKPTSCPNPLNLKMFKELPDAMSKKGGVLPVAILGTEDFDVYDIDVSSILLMGVAPAKHHYEDVTTPYAGSDSCGCTREGPDGYKDLTLKFKTAEIASVLDDVYDRQMLKLTITGMLLNGREFEGVDCVRIGSKTDATPMAPTPDTNDQVVLGAAVPNPFNPMTRISYSVPTVGFVDLAVYDVQGALVERLVARVVDAGEHFVEWDAKSAPSGVYFYRLQVGDYSETRKMILVK
jgi:hypothetical protein